MRLPPGATLVDPASMKLPPGARLVGDGIQPPASQPQPAGFLAPGTEDGFWSRTGEFVKGGVASLLNPVLHPVQTIEGMGQGVVASGMSPGGYPVFAPTGNRSIDEQNLAIQQQAQQQALNEGRTMITQHPAYTAGSVIIPAAVGAGVGKVMTRPGAPPEVLSAGKYSTAGDQLATVVKPVTGLDMPAVSNRSLPALQESFADIGADPRSFHGREGTLLYKKVVQNAIDIAEDRTKQVLAPVMQSKAPANLLNGSPDLVAWIDKDPAQITNQDVNLARQEANAALTRGNYYLKPRSKQFAASDVQLDAKNVADQSRNVLYTQAEDATGINLRPMRSQEADLINLADSANSTHNALSTKQAGFETAGIPTKVAGVVKTAIAAKAAPISTLAAGETPTFLSPLRKFNGAMQDIFADVRPQPANRNVTIGGGTAPGQYQYLTPQPGRRGLPMRTPYGLLKGPVLAPPSSVLPGRPTPFGLATAVAERQL
jgi:hypothetical protein